MKNYFHTLGIANGASVDEVRKAYRSLVKQYHPDLNKSPGAAERFIEIHEAYEFLMDDNRRMAHAYNFDHAARNAAEQARRDRMYKIWVEYQQDIARQRAQHFAQEHFSEFEKSKWYKAAQGANMLSNIIFLIFCMAIIAIPIWRYIVQLDLPDAQQKSFVVFFIPSLTGLICAAAGYYYWFVVKIHPFK